jgi:hypothetical protein
MTGLGFYNNGLWFYLFFYFGFIIMASRASESILGNDDETSLTISNEAD